MNARTSRQEVRNELLDHLGESNRGRDQLIEAIATELDVSESAVKDVLDELARYGECSRMPDSVREWNRYEAEEWGFTECDYCSGEIGLNNDGGDHSLYQQLVELGEDGGDGLDA